MSPPGAVRSLAIRFEDNQTSWLLIQDLCFSSYACPCGGMPGNRFYCWIPMRRFKVRILVLVAALAVTAVFAKGQEVEDARYGDLKALAEGLKIDIAKLAGDDDRLGELEAYKLLEWMKQEKRRPPGPSRKFLSEILDPARFANPGKAASWNVVALRIIGAISLEIRGAAATTAGFSDLLLPLLGVGSERLRQGVVDGSRTLVLEGGRNHD